MNLNKYNVLWFDDQFHDENMQEIADKAYDKYSIILNGFESAEEGLKFLVANHQFIDAILLDARFYLNEGDISGTEDLKGLRKVWDKIIQLEAQGIVLPKFIFSGQPKLDQDQTFRDTYGFFYSKHDPEELNKLFADIIEAANNRVETQIRHEYSKVFEVCSEKYIGDASQKPLFEILKSIKTPWVLFNDELYFTQIRMILEYMFRAANKLGLLHDKCIDNKGHVNLTESSLFLSGEQTKHLEVSCKVGHFSKIISDEVKSILFITGAASHTVDPDIKNNINLIEYRKAINTPYLLYSLTFQLMDILIWFRKYADNNPDKVKNKSQWLPIEIAIGDWHDGAVINYNFEKGFAFFKPDEGVFNTLIPTSIVTHNQLLNNDRVSVVIEEYKDAKTQESKTRVKELKRI